MLPIRIIAVSKMPRGPYQEVTEQYKKYLKAFARLEILEVKELAELPAGAILLDERGKEMESKAFAKFVGGFEDRGEPITFVIGGPFGFEEATKKQARHTLRLSTMTLPHDLARIVLLEQLYRAFTILRGKTYHY